MNAYLQGTAVLGADHALGQSLYDFEDTDDLGNLGDRVVAEILGGGSNIDAFKAWQEVRTSRFRDRDIDRLRARGYLPPDLADAAMADIAARDGVVGYGSHTIPVNIDLEELLGNQPIGPWWRKAADDLLYREEIVGDGALGADDFVLGADDFGPWWSRGFDPFYEVDLSDVEPQEDEFFTRTPSGGVRKVILGSVRDVR